MLTKLDPPHCPFLNHADARCATHLSLGHLDVAFDQCFGCYAGCRTYHELLGERRDRQQRSGYAPGSASYPPAALVQVRLGHHGHAG